MKKSLYWIILALLIAIPVISWILPSDYYDGNTTVCLSQSLLNFECLWCEMLNALQQLHHLNLADAIYYNALSPLVYIVLLYIWYKQLGTSLVKLGLVKKWRLLRKTLEATN